MQDPTGALGPYAYKGNQWTSFDDAATIRRKSEMVRSMGLGGAMVWALDLDDFRNTCGCERHPLLRTVNRVLRDYPVEDPECRLQNRATGKMMQSMSQLGVRVNQIPLLEHTAPAVSADDGYNVVCHFTNWAQYRRGDGSFGPEDINTDLCTHILYSFAVLDPIELMMTESDAATDLENNFYKRVTALKKTKPSIKVLISLGGWEDSAAGSKYSRLVKNKEARSRFVDGALLFIKEHGFDGLHLQWSYPTCWLVNPHYHSYKILS